jgi:hypothetical protein
VLGVTADLIFSGWREKPDVEAYQLFFAAVFKAFRLAQPQLDLNAFLRAAIARVLEYLRMRASVQFQSHLLDSTNLTPVETIARRVSMAVDRLSLEIMQSLGQSL